MDFWSSALSTVAGAVDYGSDYIEDAVKAGDSFASNSGMKTLADGAEMAEAAYGMATEGPSWADGIQLAGSGVKLAVDLAQDNAAVEGVEGMDPTGIGSMIGGTTTALGGIAGMVENSDQLNQGYLSNDEGGRNEFWSSAGDTTLGSMHAALGAATAAGLTADALEAGSVLGLPLELISVPETIGAEVLDKGLSMAELGMNGVGLASGMAGSAYNYANGLEGEEAVNTYFGASDVVGAGEHLAFDGAAGLFNYFTG